MTAEPNLAPPAVYRQSTLTAVTECGRRTYHALTSGTEDLSVGYVGASAALGTVFHEVAAEILRTLHRQREREIPTQEAIEICWQVYAQSGEVLPADERETLRTLVLRFAGYEWDTRRIMGLESRLYADVLCPDGQSRRLTGRPDLLLADSPDGIVIVDYKTSLAVPRSPRKAPPDGEPIRGKEYLSDRGHAQLDAYGLLALRAYPAAQRAVLQEFHLRRGEIREAVLGRHELEHVERELGDLMQKIDRGLQAGETDRVWRPRPGHHCLRRCPVSMSCPVPAEQRGVGAIESDQDADAQAARFAAVKGLYGQLRDRLKSYHEASGRAPEVGDGHVLRWAEKAGGSRSFGMYPPDVNGNDQQDPVDAMTAAAAARRADR